MYPASSQLLGFITWFSVLIFEACSSQLQNFMVYCSSFHKIKLKKSSSNGWGSGSQIFLNFGPHCCNTTTLHETEVKLLKNLLQKKHNTIVVMIKDFLSEIFFDKAKI